MAEPLRGLQATFDVLGRRVAERPLPDGYAFGYPRGAEWERRLAEFVPVFRAVHPAFRARVEDGGAGDRLWLHLEGPAGATEYLENTLRSIAAGAPERGVKWRWRARRATARLRPLPDFLVLGAARCGTTTLFHQLASHPEVAAPWRKEVGYFDRGFHRGTDWYRAHFPLALVRGARRTGEATPDYLFHPLAPERVRSTVPGAKLIVLLRDPVVRAHSHHQLEVRQGYETLSFEAALDAEEERLDGELERAGADASYFYERRHLFSYQARGRYAEQLERWLAVTPREQLHVLSIEAFDRDPEQELGRVLAFLELSPWSPPDARRLHTVPRLEMEPATRRRLRAYFAPHDRRLRELLGEELGWASGGAE